MTSPIAIVPELAPVLSAKDEIAVLRQAVEHSPTNFALRLRLAEKLKDADAFAELIALFDPSEDGRLTPSAAILLSSAMFAQGDPNDVHRIHAICATAAARTDHPSARARLLAEQAKALFYLGQASAGQSLLRQALAEEPESLAAFKRLAFELLREGRSREVIALCDTLEAAGVSHARLFAARTMALAALGEQAAAREVTPLDRFLDCSTLPPPPGWDLAELNKAVAAEIMTDPSLRLDRFSLASTQTWRVDAPGRVAAPAVRALLDAIVSQIEAYAAERRSDSHPWLDAMPAKAKLQSWCVITEGEGREAWHMHPYGWLSGGYYVSVPEAVQLGTDEAGCLLLGLPDGIIGEAAADFGERVVRPYAGLLALWPSQVYHRTFPHRTQGRRICLSFDVMPVD